MKDIYKKRVDNVAKALCDSRVDALVLLDNEGHRDKCIRYLTGVTSDAVLVITKDGTCMTAVWDAILAKKTAGYGAVTSYSDYDNDTYKAIEALIKKCVGESGVVEIAPYVTVSEYARIKSHLKDYVTGYNGGDSSGCCFDSYNSVIKARAIKDEAEIAIIKRAAALTDLILSDIESGVKGGKLVSESDVALFIERALRDGGAECTGFDTLCAGSERSGYIHAHPSYTSGTWGGQGLSILDFGVVIDGYTSDVTMTVARDASSEQKKLTSLVERAYKECLPLYKAGDKISDAMDKAQSIFATAGYSMPHTLGHGIGLDIHESPRVSQKNEAAFSSGMVVTLEPGLYSEVLGGVRWENDILITAGDPIELTHSKVLYL